MRKTFLKSLSYVALVVGTFSSQAVFEDNDSIADGKLVTGILYKIRCNTQNGGQRDLEAFPNYNVVRPRAASEHRDQKWWLVSAGEGKVKIRSNTVNGGIRDVEAFPNKKVARPVAPSEDQDQLWSIVPSPDLPIFAILCMTRNGGMRALEAFPNDDVVRPAVPGAFEIGDQNWTFIPEGYQIKARIDSFQYGAAIYNLASYGKRVSSVAWAASNRGGSPDVHSPRISQTRSNTFSWSFTHTRESSFLNQLDVDVTAAFMGVKGDIHNTTKWENKETSIEETKKIEVDTTSVDLQSTITVMPGKKVEYKLTWEQVEVDIPFTARVLLNGFAQRVHKDGRVEFAQVGNVDAVRSFLIQLGYDVTKILGTEGASIIAEITGMSHVSGATVGHIDKIESDI